MCAVCIERAKGTITIKEALSALREIAQTSKNMTEEELDHVTETFSNLKKKDDQQVTTQFSNKRLIIKMQREKDKLVTRWGLEEYERRLSLLEDSEDEKRKGPQK